MIKVNSGNASDIIVIGGGMAGCTAAAASARSGLRTVLIEHFGFLGGLATAGLVNLFMSFYTSDGTPLVGGIFREILDRLEKAGALLGNTFDSEYMKFVLQEMLIESGVELRLHTDFDQAQYAGAGSIIARTKSKSGAQDIECRRLIDCSGDGDAALSLGATFESGNEDGVPQAVTLMFDMGGVDLAEALNYVRDHPDQMRFPKLLPDADLCKMTDSPVSVAGYYDLVAQARARGEYRAPGDLIFYISRPAKGEVVFNTTHVGHIDGTRSEDLTRAEIEGRRQMMSVVEFVRRRVPGFESAHLLRSAVNVGVRETRRILGDYVFGENDVIGARKFDDAICRLAYPIDVHSGKGDGYTRAEERSGPQAPPAGDWYEIPYRCLLPRGLEDVLVAGRCVSSTQAGHGAIRIMPSCAAMGEAAGTAAALSIKSGVSPRDVDVQLLRRELRQRGAVV